jgi:hypothetical protein
MPFIDDDGIVECGHGDEVFCVDCGGCVDCSNCYCDDDENDFDYGDETSPPN